MKMHILSVVSTRKLLKNSVKARLFTTELIRLFTTFAEIITLHLLTALSKLIFGLLEVINFLNTPFN